MQERRLGSQERVQSHTRASPPRPGETMHRCGPATAERRAGGCLAGRAALAFLPRPGSPRTTRLQRGGHVHMTRRSSKTRKGETHMTISRVRPRLVALLTALIACIGLLSLSSLPACAAAGTVTEFNVPSGTAFGITAGPDGNLWFTDNGASAIGRITPSGSISLFPVPGSTPEYITAGADGNLWFTDRASSKIGRVTTGGSFTEFPVPTAGSALRGITAGPDGNLSFAAPDLNAIGRITPSGSITQFPSSTTCASS